MIALKILAARLRKRLERPPVLDRTSEADRMYSARLIAPARGEAWDLLLDIEAAIKEAERLEADK